MKTNSKALAKLFTTVLLSIIGSMSYANGIAAHANSQVEAASMSAAQNNGNAQNIHFNSVSPDQQTIKSAPSVGGSSYFGSFSSDSCMISGGGGISLIGVGGNIVTPIQDVQCSILRGVERLMQVSVSIGQKDPATAKKLQQAAIDSMCNLNDVVGKALLNQGVCSKYVAIEKEMMYTTSYRINQQIEP